MDEEAKEKIFILAAVANILAVLIMGISYSSQYISKFTFNLTDYRIYLSLLLLVALVITILRIVNLRQRRFPVSIKDDNISYTINDPSGKLVHCEKNQLIRANHDFIKVYEEEIIVDGTLTNFKGSVEGIASSIIPSTEKKEGVWKVQHVFHRTLPKKYIKRSFSFDFVDSFTKDSEYITCRVVNIVKDFQISLTFPENRPPKEIRGLLRKGPVEIEKERPLFHRYEGADGRVRVDWKIGNPKSGDIYKIIWDW